MASTMESSHYSSIRKTTSHGTGHSTGHSTGTNRLDNNLDALLEDLQTSVSGPTTTSKVRTISPQVEYRTASNPTKIVTEERCTTPSGNVMTTTEKYVSTGTAGSPSGIPGLDDLDVELQDVQPGQSKTVAYKQVAYSYNTKKEGKPIESWAMSDKLNKSDASLMDAVHERSFEESRSTRRHRSRSPERSTRVNRELTYSSDTSMKSGLRQVSPLPSNHRDHTYIKETSSWKEPTSSQKNITTIRTDETEEMTNVEYIPTTTPIPSNLAPGPNTKVTTTIKTYTYELPGAPEQYVSSGNLSRNVDKTISYSVPPPEKSVTYHHLDEKKSEKMFSSTRSISPVRYPPSPSTLRREEKVYVEERQGYRPVSPTIQTTTNSMARNEKYSYINGYGPRGPGDYPDHAQTTKVEKHVIYQNEPPPPTKNETRSTTINQYEEHYLSNRPPSRGSAKPASPYYPGGESSVHASSTAIYKYSNEVDHPKPFPTGGVKVYPTNGAPQNGTGPPKKLEDLMASFSDSEREVLHDIEIHEKHQQKTKKEVDFIPHTPAKVQSKNVAGPPVYYPPGSAEFSKKEEMGAASHASGGWAKERGKYEYAASSKDSEKVKTKKAVVPICLPLCCALPCVIM